MPFRGLTTDKLQINYRITSLLHHSYVRSDLCAICTPPLPERADSGFSGCAGNASRPRNKLRPRSPFSDGKNAGNRTYPGWMVSISALCTCAHTHACRKNRACAFLAGFRVVCCLFCRFPVRNALRASQAVLITDVMFNMLLYFEPSCFRCCITLLVLVLWFRLGSREDRGGYCW